MKYFYNLKSISGLTLFLEYNFIVLYQMEKYRVLSVIGSGAYSEVYKAIELQSGKTVAIKKMQLNEEHSGINRVMMRQIKLLSQLEQHPSIIKFYQFFRYKQYLCLVLDYLPMDLITFYKKHKQSTKRSLNDIQITYIFRQVCQGIAHLHSKNIMHRDIKPQNILINPENLKIKLIDFGFAKPYTSEKNTNYMVTRWYRPLQIVLGLPYDLKADIFSLGALLLQLYQQKQVFRSASNVDQLYWIVNICGSPNWQPAIQKMKELGLQIPAMEPNLRKLTKKLKPQAANIIQQMLEIVPVLRPTVFELLNHSYFNNQKRVAMRVTEDWMPKVISAKQIQCNSSIIRRSTQQSASKKRLKSLSKQFRDIVQKPHHKKYLIQANNKNLQRQNKISRQTSGNKLRKKSTDNNQSSRLNFKTENSISSANFSSYIHTRDKILHPHSQSNLVQNKISFTKHMEEKFKPYRTSSQNCIALSSQTKMIPVNQNIETREFDYRNLHNRQRTDTMFSKVKRMVTMAQNPNTRSALSNHNFAYETYKNQTYKKEPLILSGKQQSNPIRSSYYTRGYG